MTQQLQNITYSGQKIDDIDTFDILPDFLKDFYLSQNGFVAFNGGFHFRGCVKTPKWHSIKEIWFGDIKLSRLFASVDINDIPFAQFVVNSVGLSVLQAHYFSSAIRLRHRR